MYVQRSTTTENLKFWGQESEKYVSTTQRCKFEYIFEKFEFLDLHAFTHLILMSVLGDYVYGYMMMMSGRGQHSHSSMEEA
jgi:hypothetical protein